MVQNMILEMLKIVRLDVQKISMSMDTAMHSLGLDMTTNADSSQNAFHQEICAKIVLGGLLYVQDQDLPQKAQAHQGQLQLELQLDNQ